MGRGAGAAGSAGLVPIRWAVVKEELCLYLLPAMKRHVRNGEDKLRMPGILALV